VAVAEFEALQHLPPGTDGNHEEPEAYIWTRHLHNMKGGLSTRPQCSVCPKLGLFVFGYMDVI
jgi:hypothetical protein